MIRGGSGLIYLTYIDPTQTRRRDPSWRLALAIRRRVCSILSTILIRFFLPLRGGVLRYLFARYLKRSSENGSVAGGSKFGVAKSYKRIHG